MAAISGLRVSAATALSRVTLEAERKLASDSPDHVMPWGTRRDNSFNHRFNEKLWRLYPAAQVVKVLDLGCAGGEFVRTCINDGQFAVGLEGSDWSKKHKRSAWAWMDEEFLFTCDVTKPFRLHIDRQPLKFDVVTAWEFLEHIRQSDLAALAQNVWESLSPGGLWIVSITNQEDIVSGVKLHQTVRPKHCWRQKLESLNFQSVDSFLGYFAGQYVRGPKSDDEVCFHLIFTNDNSRCPEIPDVSLTDKLVDAWIGSKPQKILARLLVGY